MTDNHYGLKKAVLDSMIHTGIAYELEKIILFGSRARGDYKERSDIDIAVCGEKVEAFEAALDEGCPTLLTFDIINLNKPIQQDLLQSIQKEGVLLYEKI